jgi:hypothetical protein
MLTLTFGLVLLALAAAVFLFAIRQFRRRHTLGVGEPRGDVLMAVALGIAWFGIRAISGTGVFDQVPRDVADRVTEYAAIDMHRAMTNRVAMRGPFTIGRLVPIDKEPAQCCSATVDLGRFTRDTVQKGTNQVDAIWYDLPGRLRPRSAEEVDTIAWLEWQTETVAQYTGAAARRISCRVILIDQKQGIIVDEASFVGDPPRTPRLSDRRTG